MASISDIRNPWRDELLPAHFDGRLFHVEAGSRDSGSRIVVHEFPKKDRPYSENMGRRAIEFSVRGYCICYPSDAADPLYMRDYRLARDQLQERLETGAPGALQLPTMPMPLVVVCQRYRLTEEERSGGYCVFDMAFVELGAPPFKPAPSSREQLIQQSKALRDQIKQALGEPTHVQTWCRRSDADPATRA